MKHWEKIADEQHRDLDKPGTFYEPPVIRLEVTGGWIYLISPGWSGQTAVFVAEA